MVGHMNLEVMPVEPLIPAQHVRVVEDRLRETSLLRFLEFGKSPPEPERKNIHASNLTSKPVWTMHTLLVLRFS